MRKRKSDELRPRKSPSQTRSRATVDAILTGAARIFARDGFATGTTNRIAELAGVSIGSLYEYFPNKQALLVALLDAHIDEAATGLGQAADAALREALPLRESIAILVRAMIELHARDRALHRVLFEEAPRPPQTRRKLAAIEDVFAAALAAFLANHPQVNVRDHELAARMLVHAIEALTHRLVLHGDSERDARYEYELVTFCEAYLTAADGSSRAYTSR